MTTTTYNMNISGGCGATRATVTLNEDGTCSLHLRSRWMGQESHEYKRSGNYIRLNEEFIVIEAESDLFHLVVLSNTTHIEATFDDVPFNHLDWARDAGMLNLSPVGKGFDAILLPVEGLETDLKRNYYLFKN